MPDDLLGGVAAPLPVRILPPGYPSLVGVKVQCEQDVSSVGRQLDPEVAASKGDHPASGRIGGAVDLLQVSAVLHGGPQILGDKVRQDLQSRAQTTPADG